MGLAPLYGGQPGQQTASSSISSSVFYDHCRAVENYIGNRRREIESMDLNNVSKEQTFGGLQPVDKCQRFLREPMIPTASH